MLLEQAATRAKGADKKTIEAALAVLKDPKSPTDSALAPDLFAAMERASERTGACQLDTPQIIEVDRVAAAFASWYELFPRSLGRPQGGREADPRDRRARLRRPLLPAHPPDRRQGAQGPQQHAHRRPGRPRLAVRDRRQGGRPRRRPPRARHDGRRPQPHAPPRASTAWTSRSTSRSTRHPTTRGSRTTRSGSSSAPTARSSTPRTRPSATRTSTTSTGTRRPGASCGRRGATSSSTGSTPASSSSASTTRTPSRSRSGSG